jgi:hypothetical protein
MPEFSISASDLNITAEHDQWTAIKVEFGEFVNSVQDDLEQPGVGPDVGLPDTFT